MKNLLYSAIPEWSLNGKRVLLRADLNIPLDHGTITNDFRLQQILPTLSLISKQGGTPIVLTHIARPTGQDPAYSTKQLIPWFADQGIKVLFAQDPTELRQMQTTSQQEIILLENLRFFPGEEQKDLSFAQELANGNDYYVNDAFGTMHRNDTSITLLPRLFSPEKRTIGLLVEHELAMLRKLLVEPARPYLLMLGGAKISDKIPLLTKLLDKVDRVMLLPAIVFTVMKARGQKIGKSYIEEAMLSASQELLQQATRLQKTVYFPLDYQVAQGTLAGPLSIITSDAFAPEQIGITIGPKTIESWKKSITNAGTILFNGFPGIETRPETLWGTQQLLQSMAESKAFTVVGGGDTVGIVHQLHYEKKISFCSTGGGATIAYLSGQPLPGLLALETP